MLSSLLQQTEKSIIVDIAYHRNNGSPSTEEVISLFKDKGLCINERPYDDFEYFQYRGLVRNDQIKECKTEWLLFSDTDMVYHPEFFGRLYENIDPSFKYLYSAGRMSNPKEEANILVNGTSYPCVVETPFEKANELSLIKRRSCGAGFFQLINYNNCNHGNEYVKPRRCRDNSWSKTFHKTKSDIQFRKKLKKGDEKYEMKQMDKWFTFNQIHLNHNRDNEVGYHIEEQR
jgi:hypothetical protein